MEIVLKLRRQELFGIRWERGMKAFLLLALSCILYCRVGMYGADYRAKFEKKTANVQEIKLNTNKCTGYTEYICKNVGRAPLLFSRGQENVAVRRAAEQRSQIGIAGRVAEQRGQIGIAGRVEYPGIGETAIIEEFPFIENEEIKNHISTAEEEAEEDITFIENEEETEGDSSFIESEEEAEAEMREIAGFYVDSQGYIVGVTETLSFTDGILAVASDSECVGIRGNAFSDVEAEVFEIYIPANICEIEPGAFDVFSNLMYIEVSGESLYYYSMDGILYSKSGEEIAYPTGR